MIFFLFRSQIALRNWKKWEMSSLVFRTEIKMENYLEPSWHYFSPIWTNNSKIHAQKYFKLALYMAQQIRHNRKMEHRDWRHYVWRVFVGEDGNWFVLELFRNPFNTIGNMSSKMNLSFLFHLLVETFAKTL